MLQRPFSSTPTYSRKAAPPRQQPFPGSEPPAKPTHPSYYSNIPAQSSLQDFEPKPPPLPSDIARVLDIRLKEWSIAHRTRKMLGAYGLDVALSSTLLSQYSNGIKNRFASCQSLLEFETALEELGFDTAGLALAVDDENFFDKVESALLRNFLVSISSVPQTESPLTPAQISHIQTILQTTDLTRLPYSFGFIPARAFSRHFHLHVGPTNSGKTYSALKRLSTAETGAYAGPLRLLAHEVWERMNLGTVGGMTPGRGRSCNLITGEERRIVDPNAGLISCTVEMLPMGSGSGPFEVVVVDEIQMLGDSQRGGSWTNAILGLQAKEIHLCGDETTVNLLQQLITSLGDKLTINRYDRLTPLAVAEESLDGDYNRVEKGDCIVTFSRSNIFAVKKLVESTAGIKCAVVYGALPPETRADQARDFNDEDGRAQILVASDAVGMGLNLKIKRMIFESLHKFNGKTEVPLALTQIKQIAGRAGRFGMHKTQTPSTPAITEPNSESESPDDDPSRPDEIPLPGGVVTTLHRADLPILKALLPLPLPSITRAITDVPFQVLSALYTLLPPTVTLAELIEHVYLLVAVPKHMTTGTRHQRSAAAALVEPHKHLLTLAEIDVLTLAPVNYRDDRSVHIFTNIVTAFAEDGIVPLNEIFGQRNLPRTLDLVEGTLAELPPLPPIEGVGRRPLTPAIVISAIPELEILHKALVLYIWLSFRFELAFPDRAKAVDMKYRTEKVLDECLSRLPGLRNKKTHERGKQVDREVREWRRANVDKYGKFFDGGERARRIVKGKSNKKPLPEGWYENAERPDMRKIEWIGKDEYAGTKRKEVWRNVGFLPSSTDLLLEAK